MAASRPKLALLDSLVDINEATDPGGSARALRALVTSWPGAIVSVPGTSTGPCEDLDDLIRVPGITASGSRSSPRGIGHAAAFRLSVQGFDSIRVGRKSNSRSQDRRPAKFQPLAGLSDDYVPPDADLLDSSRRHCRPSRAPSMSLLLPDGPENGSFLRTLPFRHRITPTERPAGPYLVGGRSCRVRAKSLASFDEPRLRASTAETQAQEERPHRIPLIAR